MSYIKCYTEPIGKNKYKVHLWDEAGYDQLEWWSPAYIEDPNGEFKGINGETLSKTYRYDKRKDVNLHFHDMVPYQKFLIERYGIDDTPSTGHKEVFFDIECEIGGALTVDYIEEAPMPITSIAYWDKLKDWWTILVLDREKQLNRTVIKKTRKEIIPCETETKLLDLFLEKFRDIDPDILVGYNSDFFDIPYLYYRMCNVIGEEKAAFLSPLGKVIARKSSDFWYKNDMYVDIVGVESLD